MRTALFFCISAALHAAALAYPVFHSAPEKTLVFVSIMEGEAGGGGGGGENSSPGEKAGGAPAAHSASQKQMRRTLAQNAAPRRAAESAALAETPKTAEPVAIAAPAEPIALPVVETQAQGVIAVPIRESGVTVALESGATLSGGTAAMGSSAAAGSTSPGSGRGMGSGMGGGLGSGTGEGNGRGEGNSRVASAKASYNTCPRPETPEIARKNRWQGTATLRVLVDEKGAPTTIELYESSGFPILDRAAIDNIKQHCLFYPAREGEKRVRSWIRIPVIFPLAASQK